MGSPSELQLIESINLDVLALMQRAAADSSALSSFLIAIKDHPDRKSLTNIFSGMRIDANHPGFQVETSPGLREVDPDEIDVYINPANPIDDRVSAYLDNNLPLLLSPRQDEYIEGINILLALISNLEGFEIEEFLIPLMEVTDNFEDLCGLNRAVKSNRLQSIGVNGSRKIVDTTTIRTGDQLQAPTTQQIICKHCLLKLADDLCPGVQHTNVQVENDNHPKDRRNTRIQFHPAAILRR